MLAHHAGRAWPGAPLSARLGDPGQPLTPPGLSAKWPWLDEVTSVGVLVSSLGGPRRKPSSLPTQGGDLACSWQLWLQLCCPSLPRGMCDRSKCSRATSWAGGLETLIWFWVLPQTRPVPLNSSLTRPRCEGATQAPSPVSPKSRHLPSAGRGWQRGVRGLRLHAACERSVLHCEQYCATPLSPPGILTNKKIKPCV